MTALVPGWNGRESREEKGEFSFLWEDWVRLLPRVKRSLPAVCPVLSASACNMPRGLPCSGAYTYLSVCNPGEGVSPYFFLVTLYSVFQLLLCLVYSSPVACLRISLYCEHCDSALTVMGRSAGLAACPARVVFLSVSACL